ncbi:MAG: SRPBCC domain-containing protein [Flavobacteriaceae bacterium]
MKEWEAPIIVEENFKVSPERLWNALTDITEMRQWYFDQLVAFEPKVGFETRFPVKVNDRTFTHCWKVTEALPNQRIKYNWYYAEYEGDSYVTFEIFGEVPDVKLRFTAEVVEDFTADIPEFKRESAVNGWNYFIKERLKKYLMVG